MATFTTSAAVFAKAGKNVSTDLITGTITGGTSGALVIENWILENENFVNDATRFVWTDIYATLTSDVKLALDMVTSSLTAQNAIMYYPEGYGSTEQVQTQLDLLENKIKRALAFLGDLKVRDFMEADT